MATDTGFPQEKGPSALIPTSDLVNPFGGNSTVDLTRLISAAQATTFAINNLNSGLTVTGTVLGAIKDVIVAGGSSGILGWSSPPPTSTSVGLAGSIAYDASFFYICVGTNFWRRVAISSF